VRIEPVRGDLVEVQWVDTNESSVANPADAHLALRTSYAIFFERKQAHGIDCLVTTSTLDTPDQEPNGGWCIYPAANVLRLKIIRRVRTPSKLRPKVTEKNLNENSVPE
jgi:hypothetical protein